MADGRTLAIKSYQVKLIKAIIEAKVQEDRHFTIIDRLQTQSYENA